MKAIWGDIGKVFLPWKVTMPDLECNKRWWRMCLAASVVPFAAMLHHLVFYRPTCMLNSFGAADWFDTQVIDWFMRDPSLAWALVLVLSLTLLAQRYVMSRVLLAPLFVAFLPLSIWVWDIPLTGRIICATFHDERFQVMGIVIHGRYLYVFGALAYLGILAIQLKKLKLHWR